MNNNSEKAQFWRRLLAGLIDFILLFALFLLFFYLFLILTNWAKIKFYLWIITVFFLTFTYRIFMVSFSLQTLGQFLTNTKIYFLRENLNFKAKILVLLKKEIFLSLNWILTIFITSLLIDLSFGLNFNFFENFISQSQKLNLFQQISLSFPALLAKVNFFFLIINNLSIFGRHKTTIIDRYSNTEIHLKKSGLANNFLKAVPANFIPVDWKGN
ncbi:RDD family protein [Mesomycoplasma hyopneumoniae]|uniref:RDD family protein n=1 Tax=Mesomycoplasma hyopneumoniae TaxID=2099 RepID=UPI003DA5093A